MNVQRRLAVSWLVWLTAIVARASAQRDSAAVISAAAAVRAIIESDTTWLRGGIILDTAGLASKLRISPAQLAIVIIAVTADSRVVVDRGGACSTHGFQEPCGAFGIITYRQSKTEASARVRWWTFKPGITCTSSTEATVDVQLSSGRATVRRMKDVDYGDCGIEAPTVRQAYEPYGSNPLPFTLSDGIRMVNTMLRERAAVFAQPMMIYGCSLSRALGTHLDLRDSLAPPFRESVIGTPDGRCTATLGQTRDTPPNAAMLEFFRIEPDTVQFPGLNEVRPRMIVRVNVSRPNSSRTGGEDWLLRSPQANRWTVFGVRIVFGDS